MDFLALFLSLPATASTERMRTWRALKSLGCGALRDGVYLLPDGPGHGQRLDEVSAEALAAGGSADVFRLLPVDDSQRAGLRRLFDRSTDYATIVRECLELHAVLADLESAAAMRKLRALTRRLDHLITIDYFPGPDRQRARQALDGLREAVERHTSPGEPIARDTPVPKRAPEEFQGRIWATRSKPWVDRLASAWLIRRHIDSGAQFRWLGSAADCRDDWVGFDFDGAMFSHSGPRVTFETLLESFGLEADTALVEIGRLVHRLDVGGPAVPEAAGVESLLTGLRSLEHDDDRLLAAAMEIFDWLYAGLREAAG